MWEEEFQLLYHMGKLTLEDIDGLHVQKRKWFLERLSKQFRAEAKARKEAAARSKAARPAVRPHRRRS